MVTPIRGKKILFVVTEDWYFASHRLDFGRRLKDLGAEVAVACTVGIDQRAIESAGIRVFPLQFSRESVSPLRVLRSAIDLRRCIKCYRPDILHVVAWRSILVSRLSIIGLHNLAVVNAVTGLGSLFIGVAHGARIAATRFVVKGLSRWAFNRERSCTVFQNGEDYADFIRRGAVDPDRSFLIRGAGIELSRWIRIKETLQAPPVVLFVGRMLRTKGLKELIDASSILESRGVQHRLRLVGDRDPSNPDTLTEHELATVVGSGRIEWLGRRNDIPMQIAKCNLLVLPSYREGLPKVLLEAGAVGRAVVATDVTGCREVIVHGVNGLLVPPRNSRALADAIELAIGDAELRAKLGSRHHARVCASFSLDRVVDEFTAVYSHLFSS